MLLDLKADLGAIQKRTGVPYTTLRDWASPKSRRHNLFSFLSDMETLLGSAEKKVRSAFSDTELAAIRASMMGTAPTSDFLEPEIWEMHWRDACIYEKETILPHSPEGVAFEDFEALVEEKISRLDRAERYVLLAATMPQEKEKEND